MIKACEKKINSMIFLKL